SKVGSGLSRLKNLAVVDLDAAAGEASADLLERSMSLPAMIEDGELQLHGSSGTVAIRPRWRMRQPDGRAPGHHSHTCEGHRLWNDRRWPSGACTMSDNPLTGEVSNSKLAAVFSTGAAARDAAAALVAETGMQPSQVKLIGPDEPDANIKLE